jgi:hypothetical protein
MIDEGVMRGIGEKLNGCNTVRFMIESDRVAKREK